MFGVEPKIIMLCIWKMAWLWFPILVGLCGTAYMEAKDVREE